MMKPSIIFTLMLVNVLFAGYSQNVGIGTNTPTNNLEVVWSATLPNRASIHATNTGTAGNAILGVSNSIGTTGVRGGSNLGIGVQGYTSNGTAITGSAIGGTAVYAQGGTGYALISSGKLRFNGGNTSPSDGALLTSDANGNATWKRSGMAFYAHSAVNQIPHNEYKKVEFSVEAYDTQNGFTHYNGSVNSGSSVFTAPVAGVYHFSSAIVFETPSADQYLNPLTYGSIQLMLNGNTVTESYAPFIIHLNGNGEYTCYVYLYIDADVHLDANQKVWIEAKNRQSNHYPYKLVSLNGTSYNGRFSGELVFAD